MPSSYLSKHRPICAVLAEMQGIAEKNGDGDMLKLIEEAITYAQRMSAKLAEYKKDHDHQMR